MASGRLLVVAAFALAASGCATRGAASQLARLQSQVGLLDGRVAQLERMGTSSSAFNADSADSGSSWPAAADSSDAQSKSSSRKSSAVTVHASTKKRIASDKPSTKSIQQALKAAGFYQGELDGKMGPLTRQAIEEFQRINGLKADGVVGRQTWSQLQQYAELSGDSMPAVK